MITEFYVGLINYCETALSEYDIYFGITKGQTGEYIAINHVGQSEVSGYLSAGVGTNACRYITIQVQFGCYSMPDGQNRPTQLDAMQIADRVQEILYKKTFAIDGYRYLNNEIDSVVSVPQDTKDGYGYVVTMSYLIGTSIEALVSSSSSSSSSTSSSSSSSSLSSESSSSSSSSQSSSSSSSEDF